MPPMSSAEVSVHGSYDEYYRDELEDSLASIVLVRATLNMLVKNVRVMLA